MHTNCGKPIIRATSQFGTLVQQPSNVHNSIPSFSFFLYQFQLAIDFVTGLRRLTVSVDYIKKKFCIACGYCILCTTMPRINWLLLNTFFFGRLSLSPRALFFFSSNHFSLLSIVDICFSLLHTFNQLPKRHLFAFISLSLASVPLRPESKWPKDKTKKRRKKNIQIFSQSVIVFCHCCSRYHLDTLSKKKNLQHCTFERLNFIIIDRKSRHINRMKYNQMEIDIYFPIQLRALLLFFVSLFLYVASSFFCCCLRCCWCAQKRRLKWRNIATINKQVESKQN